MLMTSDITYSAVVAAKGANESGATISQTAGHGDFRLPTDFPSRQVIIRLPSVSMRPR